MLFPRWRFPEQHPLVALPWHLLQAQLNTSFKHPAATVVDTVKRQGRQFARANQHATAHAALRLAEGLSAFHAQHMTPSLAAFSNSALVTVRLGQLIESGRITDGYEDISWQRSCGRIFISQICDVWVSSPERAGLCRTPAAGPWDMGNVVPAECWKQWGANFLLRGAENLPVSWAPAHADWPRLSPHSPEVTVLGALLGGRSEVRRMPARTQLRQARSGDAPFVQWVWNNLCETMQRFYPTGAVDGP